MAQYVYNPFTNNLDAVGSGGGGGGNVSGPGTSVVGDIATWADTTGTTLADSGVAFPIPVASGGTGKTSLTNHGVMLGQNTSAVVVTAAGSSGQVLQSKGASADPDWTTATYPTTVASGDVIYGSATNVISTLTAPSIYGSQFRYNGTNVSWDNQWNSFSMYEDFIQGNTNNSFLYSWRSTAPGSSSVGSIDSTLGHPGIFQLNSSGSSPTLDCYNTSGSGFASIIWGAGITDIQWLVKLSALSNVTDRYTMKVGLNNTNNRFCGFQYVDNVNSGNWQIVSTDSGGNTTTNTSVAATTNWVGLRIVGNAAGTSLSFYVNGTLAGTISTNITTESTGPYATLSRSAGTASINLWCDAFSAYISMTNPRNS